MTKMAALNATVFGWLQAIPSDLGHCGEKYEFDLSHRLESRFKSLASGL